ncbi:unnamed protein product [Microthlaspi erraticum]|uniref:F-box domain-containing protein n=1 Tax=Microthlaspi erraticum TaxID=1685480 RepID=A0A6D2KL95_9BRAS|nr:unnamed protein product [Microthlaspi erraticum]
MMELDPLSSLPDEVRSHILSFLTTKEAASTSLLSKRWRNLFALVPNLDIDDSVFLHPEKGKRERDGILQSFMEFVDRVLALQRDSPIKKLSLKCSTGVSPLRVNFWIRNVLRRGVSELDLTVDFGDEYRLPLEMFVSKTLVSLKLTTKFVLRWWPGAGGEGTCLPMLKRLYVEAKMVFCDDKVERLLQSCPVLEDMYMRDLLWSNLDENLSSATLTRLKLCAMGSKIFQNPKTVSFDAPNLRHLSYADLVAEDYPLVNMKNLFEARILLLLTEDEVKRIRAAPNDDDVVLRFGNVVKLMNGIQSVQVLHLESDTLEVLSLCRESMPVFNKVKTLCISSDERRGWQVVPGLLRNCPNLEFLLFHGLVHHVTDGCGDACDCNYRRDKGRSLRSCPVKYIQIQGFRGTMKEMRMIEHFLDYFPCLKEMRIYVEENGPTPLRDDFEASELVVEMIEDYKDMYDCKVKLLMTDYLVNKWTSELGL